MRKINRILKKNYSILEKLNPRKKPQHLKVPWRKMALTSIISHTFMKPGLGEFTISAMIRDFQRWKTTSFACQGEK